MNRIKYTYLLIMASVSVNGQQIGNYVQNGSFEELRTTCNPGLYLPVLKYWSAIDTTKNGFATLNALCGTMPFVSFCDYQYPRTGGGFVMNSIWIQNGNRAYFRNTLKGTLQLGKVYCVKYHVNVRNCQAIGIDAYGVYFGDNSLDTITNPYQPKTYLVPQVVNPPGNYVTDTLNWTTLTGTFTATGIEKFLVIGNFKSDANTGTVQIQPPYTNVWCDINLDDVSVIESNLPAYAGPDQYCIPGDSVFVGRKPDFAIDSGCVWYKLPFILQPIDTTSGLWVKPTTTSTYVVRQELDCSPLKWDTVVVFMDAVGLKDLQWYSDNITMFPNPTVTDLTVTFGFQADISTISIINSHGQTIREVDLQIQKTEFTVSTSHLEKGIYLIQFKTSVGTLTKTFVKN